MSSWSTTAANNVLANTGINMDEGMAPSAVNDGVRAIMAAIKTGIDTGTIVNAGLTDLSGAAAGQIKFPATQNASSDANTLDDYDEYAGASAACSGAITASFGWDITKVGRLVTLHLPAANATAGATQPSFTFGTVIPAKYRPAVNVSFAIPVDNNGAPQLYAGRCYVAAATGVISIYRLGDYTSNLTNGSNVGLAYSTSVSWKV